MSLEEILEQVRADGAAQAAEVRRQTEAEASAILEETRQEAATARQAELAATERTIELLRARELPTAELTVERERQVMLRRLLEQVRRRSLEKLAQLPEADRRRLYKRLLEGAGPLEGKLRCRKAEAKLLEELTGLKADLQHPLSEPGFVIEGATSRLDLRLASLVEAAWSDHLKQVYGVLLGQK